MAHPAIHYLWAAAGRAMLFAVIDKSASGFVTREARLPQRERFLLLSYGGRRYRLLQQP
jgi:hypothetical protein